MRERCALQLLGGRSGESAWACFTFSKNFYERLGFEVVIDGGYDAGHPIIMRHKNGLVFNLLGPATKRQGENVLMDEADKYPGITHVALKIDSIEDAEKLFADAGIEITGRREFRGVKAVFIRDPDRNVLEIIDPGPDVAELIADHQQRALNNLCMGRLEQQS